MHTNNKGSQQALSTEAQKTGRTKFAQVIIAIALATMLAFAATGCSTPEEPSEPAPGEATIEVTMVIDCSEAVEAGNKTAIAAAEDGIVYDDTLVLKDFETVLDALIASNVEYISNDSTMGKYVSSIAGLGMGDQGDMSGWVFTLNGESVTVSADEQKLEDGDHIEWKFVLEPEF